MNGNIFIAIAVGQGDAFFMEKGDRTLLIDGGKSRVCFPHRFVVVTGRKYVNVLVCTHSDSDHASGLLGFLGERGFRAEQVWLPASWMDRLRDLIHKPEDFMKELIMEIQKLSDNEVDNLAKIGERYANTRHDEEDLVAEVKYKDLLESIERADAAESVLRRFYCSQPFSRNRHPLNMRLKLLLEAISASDLIRQIFLAAYRSGSVIRWFDYVGDNAQIKSSGGIRDFLIPLNAIEVGQIRRPKRSALKYIALTRSNRQSLVFMNPADELSSGILFTADSKLSFSQTVPWNGNMLITSPHHGSELNKYAYQRFLQETRGETHVNWVRSDGKSLKRPGKSFRALRDKKYCTLCRPYKSPRQNVKMVFSKPNCDWQPDNTRQCGCK